MNDRVNNARDHHGLPTPRSTLRAGYLDVLVWCKACHRQAPADLQKLVDEGRGDTPLIHLKYRCNCGSRLTDWVVTSMYGGRPAWSSDEVNCRNCIASTGPQADSQPPNREE